MIYLQIDTTTASVIVSLAIFIATIVLAYFTYILGKHTLLLSKLQITPLFEAVGQSPYRLPTGTELMTITFKNRGNGLAVDLECSHRVNGGEERELRPSRRNIEPSDLFWVEFGPKAGEKIDIQLKYYDIMRTKKEPYKQSFQFSF